MPRQPKYRYWDAIHRGAKVPRKAKKQLIGLKISSNQLSRLLKKISLTLYKPEFGGYPIVKINPYPFCPKCGCQGQRSVLRSGYWPEVFNSYFCLRCDYLVAWEDNSPYTHCLESMLNDQYEEQIGSGIDNLPVYAYPEY